MVLHQKPNRAQEQWVLLMFNNYASANMSCLKNISKQIEMCDCFIITSCASVPLGGWSCLWTNRAAKTVDRRPTEYLFPSEIKFKHCLSPSVRSNNCTSRQKCSYRVYGKDKGEGWGLKHSLQTPKVLFWNMLSSNMTESKTEIKKKMALVPVWRMFRTEMISFTPTWFIEHIKPVYPETTGIQHLWTFDIYGRHECHHKDWNIEDVFLVGSLIVITQYLHTCSFIYEPVH